VALCALQQKALLDLHTVKHGYVKRPVDWAHSSIHRYIRQGILPATWCGDGIVIPDSIYAAESEQENERNLIVTPNQVSF
jgi:hypothetical protein